MKCIERWKIIHRMHTAQWNWKWPVKHETNVDNDKIGHTNHRHSRNYIENYVNVIYSYGERERTNRKLRSSSVDRPVARPIGDPLSKDLETWEMKVIYFRLRLFCIWLLLFFNNKMIINQCEFFFHSHIVLFIIFYYSIVFSYCSTSTVLTELLHFRLFLNHLFY